jgi:hypothetical protein
VANPVREAPLSRSIARGAALSLGGIIVVLAVLQLRGWSGDVNADGVSYLDLAGRYARGELGAISNGYWSPLYPMLLGGVLGTARAVGISANEMTVVFAVNAAIFGLAALALARLARSLGAQEQSSPTGLVSSAFRGLAVGALGIWCLLRMINATTVTPDALLAALLFLVSAQIVDALSHPPNARRDLWFGIALALGYWTKAVFLPVAFVALAAYVAAVQASDRRRTLVRALVPFLLVAAPLVAVQSWSQGRPSFGETGRLNYRWYVGGAEHAPAVVESVAATRARAARRESSAVRLDAWPASTLFVGDVEGSFPYWYDPSRFEPAGTAPFSLAAQMRVLAFNARWFRVVAGAFALWCVVALGASLARGQARPRRLLAALPSAAMLLLYALTHPEGRMAAASIVCVLVVCIHLADAGPHPRRRALLAVECAALAIVGLLAIGRSVKRIPTVASDSVAPSVAAALRGAGIANGARVAVAGSPYGQLWAHQAGVQIVLVLDQAMAPQPMSAALLRAATNEAAARGVPVDAVIGNGDVTRPAEARAIAPGWWVLPAR